MFIALNANINKKVVTRNGLVRNATNSNNRVNRVAMRPNKFSYAYKGGNYLRAITDTANIIGLTHGRTRRCTNGTRLGFVVSSNRRVASGVVFSLTGRKSRLTMLMISHTTCCLNLTYDRVNGLLGPTCVIVNNNMSTTKRCLLRRMEACFTSFAFPGIGGAARVGLTTLKGSTKVIKTYCLTLVRADGWVGPNEGSLRVFQVKGYKEVKGNVVGEQLTPVVLSLSDVLVLATYTRQLSCPRRSKMDRRDLSSNPSVQSVPGSRFLYAMN